MAESNAMTAKAVRKEIEDAIEPWRAKDEQPPFTMDQLALMALLLADKPLTKDGIYFWIADTFTFFGRIAYRYAWTAADDYPQRFHGGRARNIADLSQVPSMLSYTLNKFEMPLQSNGSATEKSWTIDIRHRREALSGVLGSQQPDTVGRFDFFGLPAEIRMIVYEMVFSCPKSGVWVASRKRKHNVFRFKTRSFDEPFDYSSWQSQSDSENWLITTPTLRQKPMREILAPLLICRQFYDEAMPMFYRINHFVVRDLSCLKVMLLKAGKDRRTHFTHISVTYDVGAPWGCLRYTDALLALRVFKVLSETEDLKKLDLYIREKDWLDRGRGRRLPVKKYQTVSTLPGLKTLRRMRYLDRVKLYGPCPNIKAMLAQAIQKRNIMKSVASGSKKRKQPTASVEEPEEEEEQGPKRRRSG